MNFLYIQVRTFYTLPHFTGMYTSTRYFSQLHQTARSESDVWLAVWHFGPSSRKYNFSCQIISLVYLIRRSTDTNSALRIITTLHCSNVYKCFAVYMSLVHTHTRKYVCMCMFAYLKDIDYLMIATFQTFKGTISTYSNFKKPWSSGCWWYTLPQVTRHLQHEMVCLVITTLLW